MDTGKPLLLDGHSQPLLFSVNEQGTLLSLGWPLATRYGIDLQQPVGHPLEQLVITPNPLNLQPWLSDRSADPVAGVWHLRLGTRRIAGQVYLQSLSVPDQGVQLVGSLHITDVSPVGAIATTPWINTYRSELTQLPWKIRRTLDLETIWQHTIDGLSAIFQAQWGAICAYEPHGTEAEVIATATNAVCQPPFSGRLRLADHPRLWEALRGRRPIASSQLGCEETDSARPVLITATCHQNEPNGIILLATDQESGWEGLDGDLFQEVVDQVGTAIAHAHLFRDAQGLADELQAANQRLRQKHRELEDARQQAEEASRLKSEFLANTSHELRTPLNGMIGFLKLILDGMADDPEEQQEFLQEAHKSAIHLLNLINDVLDIAKIEAGKMQIDMAPVKLSELFAAVENFTRPQAERKSLEFELFVPSTRDEILVHGNYQRLLQVMLNLVGNAIKFTHEGSITISAEIKFQKVQFQGQEWPGVLKVSVADTGIGVSLEKQDRLFQTFSQVDGERTRQYGGTGLGLAISQRLVEAMGGVVQFISMGEGLGSTVTFTVLLYQEPVIVE